MVQHGVAAIVGPNDDSVASHIQSLAEALKVPHIETRSAETLRQKLDTHLATLSTSKPV